MTPGTVGVTGRGIFTGAILIYSREQTGKYYMFICASSKVTGNFQGCVLAVSEKFWTLQVATAAINVPVDAVEGWPYYHLERPQVIYKNGKYNLFFSCFKQFFNLKWLQQVKHKKN